MLRNRFNKIIAVAVIAIMSNHNVIAQTKSEFSAKQAVDYGLKNSIQVKNALLDIQNQEQNNREITSAAYPQINGSLGLTRYFNIPVQPIPDFISPLVDSALKKQQVINGNGQQIGSLKNTSPDTGSTKAIPVPFGTNWTGAATITLTQTIFDGQVFIGLQARSVALDFYKKEAEVTEDQIKANIYKVYYQLVVGQNQLASIQANIDQYEKLLHDTKEIYKNGFAEKLDIDKITVQLNNLQTQKQVIENQLAAGNAGLKFLINMPQKNELILTDTLSEDELKSNILDENYNYNDRKDIQLLTLSTKLNGYNVKRYEVSRLPTLSATAAYSKTAFGSEFNFINGDWYTTSFIGLNLNIPIFSGFYKSAKVQEAKIALQKSKNNLELLKQSVDNDVAQSRINMKSALATMDNQKQNIQLAQQVFNSTRLKYDQGLGSNQEIYDAQTQLEVAQNNYYGALYDAIIAKINYLQAVGKL
jgi:outer membrane protein